MPSGSLIKYYSAGGLSLGENTASDASGSGISYLVSDSLGSVTETLNQTGTATGAQLYSPYGGVRYSSGTMPTAKGFTGQYADGSTGLDYYGARYYDPALGQFTSADTVTDGANGLNRYAYVGGNPETRTDPTGHCWIVCAAIAGAVVGAVVGVVSVVQAARSGNLTGGTIARAVADVALGAGAGAALAANPVGAGFGVAGALAGIGLGMASGGSFDLQSGFESVAAGSITGAVGGGLGGVIVKSGGDAGLTFASRVVGQGIVSGGGDAATQIVGQFGTGQPFQYHWGETIASVGVGAVFSSFGAYLDIAAPRSGVSNKVLDNLFQLTGSGIVGGVYGSAATQRQYNARNKASAATPRGNSFDDTSISQVHRYGLVI